MPPIRANSCDGAHVAEPGGVDGTGLYGCALVRFRHPVGEVRVEVGHPLEAAFHEAAFEFAPHRPGVVEALLGPSGEVRPGGYPAPSLALLRDTIPSGPLLLRLPLRDGPRAEASQRAAPPLRRAGRRQGVVRRQVSLPATSEISPLWRARRTPSESST